MATLFHMDVLRLSDKDRVGTQFIEIIGSGTITTPEDPDGAMYPLPAEYHPMIVAIVDTLRYAETLDHDGVRRFFFREYGSGDIRLIIQVQPYHDYLVAAQQNDANHGVLVAHDCGVDLRVTQHDAFHHLAKLNFVTRTGTLDNRVGGYLINEGEMNALIEALTAVRDGKELTGLPLIGNQQWRDRLNALAEERVGIPYQRFQESRGEVAA